MGVEANSLLMFVNHFNAFQNARVISNWELGLKHRPFMKL
jgi:hypothetical protein